MKKILNIKEFYKKTENLVYFGLSKLFFYTTPKACSTKEKSNKVDFLKSKNSTQKTLKENEETSQRLGISIRKIYI